MPYSYDKKIVLKIKYFSRGLTKRDKEAPNLSVILKDKRVCFMKRPQPKAVSVQQGHLQRQDL